MALTSEQHAEIAASYAKAASDLFISPEQRDVFARKAEFFRLMAKLAAKKSASAQTADPPAPKQPPETIPSGDALPKAVEEFLERSGSTESSRPSQALEFQTPKAAGIEKSPNEEARSAGVQAGLLLRNTILNRDNWRSLNGGPLTIAPDPAPQTSDPGSSSKVALRR